MKKFFVKYSLFLILNLTIFLGIGYFLDKYFKTNGKILIGTLIFSIIPLVFISFGMIKKNIRELEKINKKLKK